MILISPHSASLAPLFPPCVNRSRRCVITSLLAIILAAGRGSRLAEHNPEGHPKCLMPFGGRSLLARHH